MFCKAAVGKIVYVTRSKSVIRSLRSASLCEGNTNNAALCDLITETTILNPSFCGNMNGTCLQNLWFAYIFSYLIDGRYVTLDFSRPRKRKFFLNEWGISRYWGLLKGQPHRRRVPEMKTKPTSSIKVMVDKWESHRVDALPEPGVEDRSPH